MRKSNYNDEKKHRMSFKKKAAEKKLAGLVWWPVWACPSIGCMDKDDIVTALDPKHLCIRKLKKMGSGKTNSLEP
jgi:hypothetical protein